MPRRLSRTKTTPSTAAAAAAAAPATASTSAAADPPAPPQANPPTATASSRANAAASVSAAGSQSTAAASSETPLAASSAQSRRKSVAFDVGPPAATGSTSAATASQASATAPRRSRRTSASTNTTDSPTSASQASAKALGKRRAVSPGPSSSIAVSPPASDPNDPTPTPDANQSKRRKLGHGKQAEVAATTQTDKPKTRSKRLPRAAATPPVATSSVTMPRKGTRAGRAAAAKARAMEDEQDARRFDDDPEQQDDVDMDEVADVPVPARKGRRSSAAATRQKRGNQSPQLVAVADPEPEGAAGPSVSGAGSSSSARADAGSAEKDEAAASKSQEHLETTGAAAEERDFSDGDEDEDEDDEDDDDEDESDEHDFDDEDDFIDEYEASLGLHGEERDDYGDEGEEDLHDAPRTFTADGDPLSEGAEHEAGLDEADAAFLSALTGAMRGNGAGSGGAGGDDMPGGMGGPLGGLSAFRALHGMMSGTTTRLKALLEALRKKDGDGQAKLGALQELAELLSISTEDTLGGYFQLEAFAKELIAIVRGDSNGMSVSGNAGGDGDNGMTVEEAIAFGLDPAEVGAGVGGDTEENDVQMMLLACRCLANLMEALPGSAHSVVYAGAVPVLCDKLKDIQYIDLAEQTLSTLEKISEEVPSSIVREGGLMALLSYIDFFSFHVQRTAITAAANCCRSLSLESFDRVVEVIPIFKNILGYPDQRVVEQACLATVRIVDSYRYHPDKLEQLMSKDLIVAIKGIINPDSTTVSASTYTQCLKMLTTAVKASPAVAINLVELDIANTLYHLLTGVAPPEWKSNEGQQVLDSDTAAEDNMLVMQNLVQRPNEVAEVLNLVTELLPPLPKDGVFDSRAFSGKSSSSRSAQKGKKPEPSTSASSVKQEEATPDLSTPAAPGVPAAASEDSADVKMEDAEDKKPETAGPSAAVLSSLRAPALGRVSSSSSRSRTKPRDANKEAMTAKRLELVASDAPAERKLVVKRYIALLLPTLIDVYAASVSTSVRSKAVTGMLKMVNFCEEGALAEILHSVPLAAFISAVLSTRENQAPLVTSALQLVELLLLKMRDAYQYTFRREGVMHEIERLAQRPLVSPTKSKRSSPARTPKDESETPFLSASSGLSRALLGQSGPDSASKSPSELQAQDAVTLRARHLSETYGAPESQPSLRAQAMLERIVALVKHVDSVAHADVGAGGVRAVAKIEQEAKEALDEIAQLFADEKNPLSSFEMLESGLVDGVLKFAIESGTGPLSPRRRQELLAKAFMPQLEGGNPSPAFVTLVKRLQESLSRMEEFEVVVAAQGAGDVDSRRSGTSMLGRQLRLRLVADDSDIPRSCTNIVVSIHAIATFESFNAYLRPRILAAQAQAERLSSGLPSGSGGGTLSSLLAAFAAAAGAEDDEDGDADEAILSSSPPPRRAELSNPDAGTSAGLNERRSSSTGRGPNDAGPKRRRSSRLSGKGVDLADESAATGASGAESSGEAMIEASYGADDDSCAAEDSLGRQGSMFPRSLDAPEPPKDDKLVHLEVNDEGAEGGKLVAKTPDGTRVATPQPGSATEATGEGSQSRPTPTPKPRASYAAAVKSEPTDFHLEFKLGGRDVGLDTTIFGAVHRHESEKPNPALSSMWYNVYDVRYRKVPGPARSDEDDANALAERARREGSISDNMPASIAAGSQQGKILQLLHVLRGVVADYAEDDTDPAKTVAFASSAFVNRKLTAKLNRQLEEPMIVASACLPDWAIDLAQTFPFLFPFDTRYTFLQSTSFGYARLLQKWVGQARPDTSRRDDNLGYLGRLPRQKVRISRDRILESAYKVFELYGSSRASLEVEFFNEVGSGLGPTLEFYALVSKEFARKGLGLWRDGDHTDTSEYVHAKAGLFPRPTEDFASEEGKKVLRVFRILGQFVAKAMMDSRIIDINFSRPFMRLVLEQEMPLTISSVRAVDPDLARSLQHLQKFLDAKADIDAGSLDAPDKTAALKALSIEESNVEDLSLNFTLPGSDIELRAGGKDEEVDIFNLDEYVEAVLDWTLRRGVSTQIDEFKKGFSSVFSVRDLQTFSPVELVMMTASFDEDWSLETLTNSTKADHGFTMDSRPVRDFLSIMSEFTPEERREFLSFITGSPRLPIGGFAALSPPLTIVRKGGGDKELLSCMTCVNYVKLPDYSSREIVRDRLRLAVREGAGGFHLS